MIAFILQIILSLILLAVFLLVLLWSWASFKTSGPFIPVPSSVVPHIHRALAIKEGSIVYNLGCGDARILLYSANRVPESTYVGIETNPFLAVLARVSVWWYAPRGKKNIQIIQKDFSTYDLSKATHLCAYIYPNILDDMLPNLERTLAPGTRLVSVAFRFTQKPAIAEIDLERRSYQRARKLYVYEF